MKNMFRLLLFVIVCFCVPVFAYDQSFLYADILNGVGNLFVSVLGIISWIVVIIVIIALGYVLNSCHKKIYGLGTYLSYIPFANSYIATKIAFGEDFANKYVFALIIAIPLFFIKYLNIIASLINAVALVAIVIVIIRWLKSEFNYDLFKIKENELTEKDNDVTFESVMEDASDEMDSDNIKNEEAVMNDMEINAADEDEETILNLDYNSGGLDAKVNDKEDSNDARKDDKSVSDKSVPEGESDLMNLFK